MGLLIGAIIHWVEHHIDDGPIEITISIMVPYAAYLAAEFIHASGVLAVVACGLYLGRGSAHFFSPAVRIQANAVWSVFTFILNGFVFVSDWSAIARCERGDQELQLRILAALRWFVQSAGDRSAAAVGFSRHGAGLLDTPPGPSPE